jgi:malate permease and related proteins
VLLVEVFAEVLLPLVLLTSLGALVGRLVGMPVEPLSNLVYNLFTPALVFEVLVSVDIAAGLVSRIVFVVGAGFVVSAGLGLGWAALRGRSRPVAAGAALSLAVVNLGNMGLPVAGLAFGDDGLAVAVVAFVAGSVLNNSLGIVIASLSEGRLVTALRAPLSVPALWAVLPALAVRGFDLGLPSWLGATTGMLAQAAIPVMLVVLGLQATTGRPTRRDLGSAAAPALVRLTTGPAIAWGAAVAVGLDGLVLRTLVVLGGMPTAVIATIIATRHAAAPARVARVVLVSTICSFVTLTVLIAWLR